MRFARVAQVRPPGDPHASCLDHVARAFSSASGLPLEDVWPSPSSGDIVIGGHLLRAGMFVKGCAFWNSEVVDRRSPWLKKPYLDNLRRNEVWDYDLENVRAWKEFGVAAEFCPLGFDPSMAWGEYVHFCTGRPVFYGSVNERRRDMLARMDVDVIRFETYGEPLREEIRRASCVVNLHFYSRGIFEMVRCSELFANGVPVLSEESRGWFWQSILPDETFQLSHARNPPEGLEDIAEAQTEAYSRLWLKDVLAELL